MSINTVENLKKLIKKNPEDKGAIAYLAHLYTQNRDWEKASSCYAKIITLNVNDANSYFNYAYNLRFLGEYKKAIEQYEKSLYLNVSQPEEVYLNIAIIYSDYLNEEQQAISALNSAIKINSNYIPALYNLANLYEDNGDKEKAIQLFEQIILIQPSYYDALARLAQIKKFGSSNDSLIDKLMNANLDNNINLSVKVNINYALGKAFDDCGEYTLAFRYFSQANELDKKTSKPYNHQNHLEHIKQIINVFSSNYFDSFSKISNASPVFICGMFRSGSTLVEQILAAHTQVSAGGEQEFFIRLVSDELKPYPSSLLNTGFNKLQSIAKNYLDDLKIKFPNVGMVTDKRPENYLYLGLIKVLFPNAKFIFTQRNILDNCLSIYFLRLGNRMSYSLDLNDIVDYYQSHEQLMSFWKNKFPKSIYTINYDKLVSSPENEIKGLVNFLNLDWDANCLNFHKVDNTVKTASVWQVRKPLYKSSSGRWKNYENDITELLKYASH